MDRKTQTIRLTRSAIDRLKATSNRSIYWDDSIIGYGLRVMPTGTKTFFFQGRIRGELIRVTIGRYPARNAEQARNEAKKIQGQLAAGIDPRPEKTMATASMFGDLMDAYCELLESRGKQSANSVRNAIHRDVKEAFPKLWKKPASSIDLDDCMIIVGRLVDDQKLRQADKLRSYIRTAFSEAINARGDASMPQGMRNLAIRINPARELRKVKGSNNAKDRALTLSEFRAYWEHVKALPEPARSLAMLHTLTGGQRQLQLARVTIEDVDHDGHYMRILDYKGRRSEPRIHIIPLLPEAMQAIRRIGGTGRYIFSCDGGLKPVHGGFMNHVVGKIRAQMEESGQLEKGHFTAGSIRATIETRLVAKPYRVTSDVLAQLLSHGLGGIQARHYQHHDFFDEKLEALQMLYRMIEGKPEPNIIQLRGIA
ncbi:MAG: integrase family protein [Nitrosomonas sp.]|nr:integrase family protein [Nitrosomonas sp.]